MLSFLAIFQGIYYLARGVWSLVSIDTFQAVTGPKTDLWLVKTVGVMVSVVGLVLILAGFRNNVTTEIFLLAVGCAFALGGIDVYYVSKRVISKVYLLDAAIEAVLILGWLVGAGLVPARLR